MIACLSSVSTVLNSSPEDNSTTVANVSKPKPFTPPQIATVPGWKYKGCWTDDPLDRTLVAKRRVGSLTVQRCARICKGYKYFGVEYSNESVFLSSLCRVQSANGCKLTFCRCYCGNSLATSARKELDSVCNRSCMSDFSQICGGRNTLSMYEVDTEPIATTIGNSTSPASSTGQNATAPMVDEVSQSTVSRTPLSGAEPGSLVSPPRPPQIVTIPNWSHRGCWTDSPKERTLTEKEWQGELLTVQRCAIICRGYSYFGVEDGTQ